MSLAVVSTRYESGSLSGMMLGAVSFAFMTATDAIFKLVAENHPAFQILFVNAIFALIPIVTWTILTGGLSRLRTTRPLHHLARGSISVLSAFAAIYAYSRLSLTDFYAIVFSGPLLITAMSVLWLGEKIDQARWLAIAVGFGGILIVVNPFAPTGHGAEIGAGRVAAFISIACYAFSMTIVRRMRRGESSVAFAFYGYISTLIVCGTIFLLQEAPALSFQDIEHIGMAGMLAGIASICLLTAYHRTPVSLVAPFQYTQIIWGALAGYCIWGRVPQQSLALGAAIVAASGLFVIYQEIRPKDQSQTT